MGVSMMTILRTLVLLITASHIAPAMASAAGKSLIDWQSWSDDVFVMAERENRLVLLNLEAVWCHWCHVMDQETYSDPAVAETIRRYYLPVLVDHDARPDLANRYREYGWPATIMFSSQGTEIVKRAGYIAPDRFNRLLLAIVEDPTPERNAIRSRPEQFAGSAFVSEELRKQLIDKHLKSYDWEQGGFKSQIKSLDRDMVEYAMSMAALGDETEEKITRQTIEASFALIDPAWGGVYQYSTYGRWDNPHYEKIMASQAGYLRIYALAYAQWGDPKYLQAAEAVERYLHDFLTTPEGAYYTSQDADLIQGQKATDFFALRDQERRALGVPRIDKHIYSRENGWAIEALATMYEVTGEPKYLTQALRAANWIRNNRSLPGGGFRHDKSDSGGPYLADTLNMGRAFLQLYRATGERRWLRAAADAADFIGEHFRQQGAGFLAGASGNNPVGPVPHIDENVSVIRFFNLLARYTGDLGYRRLAEHGMRYLAIEDVALRRIEESGVLLADLELSMDPAHYTVIGPKSSALSLQLYDVALRESGWYKRIEWWDVAEGPLPNEDIKYPVFDKPAAFVCTNSRCSIPAFEPGAYKELIDRIRGTYQEAG